ncbi:MAG: hydrolase 2, exosortase A system-associated [Deltaproteobacteria bacterium]|nr:hydrolase 2, exosortase A system-associated [Deltaproteobacteria bacterium]
MNHKRDVFFIPSKSGDLFAVYYHPSGQTSFARGDILYIHPFADEMNKSRRMAALQAGLFSQKGFGILQIDLFGCGDSKGEFGDATWDIWKDNINTAIEWLIVKKGKKISLWGLRLGALLMMDFVKNSRVPIEKYIFWQPVLNGKMAMHQFFRLALASQIMGRDQESSKEIREKLSREQNVEIGGYELNHELVNMIERINMADLCPLPGSRIIWKEISFNDSGNIAPGTSKLVENFKQKGCIVETELVKGNSFWNTIEIAILPELIQSTTNSMISD